MNSRRGLRSSATGALCALALLSTPGAALAATDVMLYDGQPGSAPLLGTSCPECAAEASNAGSDGGPALALKPDAWHNPAYNLYCGGQPRRDLSAFDVLEFKMRAATADGGAPTFFVRTWDKVGTEVPVSKYIEGGKVDTTWRTVRVPIADLATPNWNLGNVERLVWGKDANNRVWYVDNVAARDIYGPSITDVGAVSASVLRLDVSEGFQTPSVRDPSHFTVTSTTDAAYAGGLHPVSTGVNIRFHDFGSGDEPLSDYAILLRLPVPMKPGHVYAVTAAGVQDTAGNPSTPATLPFVWDDLTQVNPVIKVNQVGYLPDRPKLGYVGGYVGDLGGAVWAVGDGGAIARWDIDRGWSNGDSPVTTRLDGVASTTEDRAVAVGVGGTILGWNGKVWSKLTSPTTVDLHAATYGPTRIGWIVGDGGTVLRNAGAGWVKTTTPTTKNLRAVWAGADDDAWAVGDGGTILRWSGSAWATVASSTTADLLAIDGPHADWLWAVGSGGTVLLRQWGKWAAFSGRPSSTVTLRGVAADSNGGVWVAGDGGTIWGRTGFGTIPFTAQTTGTTASLRTLARLDERRIFGLGAAGATVGREGTGWTGSTLGSATWNHVSALPYGALRLPEPTPQVTLIDEKTGAAVDALPLELRASNWTMSGEDVYMFDFTAFSTPGTYRAWVPGIGLSDPFRIGADVLSGVAYTTARSFYYQRCGEELVAPFVDPGYERGLCHSSAQDAAYDVSLPNTPLYAGEKVGAKIDASGGWHDAGDFGKYQPTAAAAVWYLLEGYALDPAKYTDGSWNIPESGNGVPDILDEARVGIDWMLKVQRFDGAIPHKVTAACWFNGMPEDESAQRYIYEHSTYDTATGAAVFASAARVYAKIDPAQSAKYLAAAKKAWTFIAAHPNPTPAGGVANPPGNCTGEYTESDDIDNRMWAAVELYRTTGEAQYRTAFDGWWKTNGTQWGYNDWLHHYRKAYWGYLRTTFPTDATIVASIKGAFISQADTMVDYTLSNAYMNGTRLDVPEWIGWGAFTMGPKVAFPLLQAFALTGNESYRDMAAINADAQLGVNPLSLTFITGVGARSPKNPLDMESEYDGIDAPVPGLPVFGPHHNQSKGNKFQAATQDDTNNYPWTWTTSDPLPVLRRFNDSFELPMQTEFTVLEQALTTVTFHLLSESTSPLPPAEVACGGAGACDDGNPCTTDTCDPALGCFNTDVAGGCNDGDACTVGDTCAAGACAGTPVACNDGNPCTKDACDPAKGCVSTPTTAACNDGNACTVGDSCSGGACAGAPLSCDDGDPCTIDACASATGCSHVADPACDAPPALCTSDAACADGDPCTVDTCDPATGCAHAPAAACQAPAPLCAGNASCDDGNPCTKDTCDPAVGCRHSPTSGSCDDGDACTTNDRCSWGGVCKGRHKKCGRSSSCEPTTGMCI